MVNNLIIGKTNKSALKLSRYELKYRLTKIKALLIVLTISIGKLVLPV